MAKVKFDAEDFRKDPNQTSPVKPTSKGYLKYVLWCGLVIVCAILAIIFVPRGCSNEDKPIVDTLVTDSMSSDSIPPIVVDSVDSDSLETTPKVVEDENVNNPGSVATDNKTEKNKYVKTDVVNLSEDVVKEALSVIRGNYGNNPDRRRLLKERYQEIQNQVNELYRNGQVT